MTAIGKKNMVVAPLYFILTLGLGMFLMQKGQAGVSGWAESTTHKLLAGAHVHGSLEALVNVVFGYLLCRFGKNSELLARIASWLLLVGMLHSGGAYLAGLGITGAKLLAPLGAVSLIGGIVCMVPVLAKADLG
ncbi:hypothetical protein Ptc2401_01248 [Prosthecochloris sp. CIB 2401]|nr:hypothetical protein Ptc2401_01248 [Prosthecochloris sp. CIB 2401]